MIKLIEWLKDVWLKRKAKKEDERIDKIELHVYHHIPDVEKLHSLSMAFANEIKKED